MTSLVYPVVVHWVWSPTGWLSRANPDAVLGGVYDFAGGGVVHLVGGTMALLAAKVVGPRAGRFGLTPGAGGRVLAVEMRGHSSVLVVLGTFLLWIGWIGFNIGATETVTAPGAAVLAAQVAVRTTLAGSAGCLVAIGAGRCVRAQVWSLEAACNGLLAGLVSITASVSAVGGTEAILIGAVGGLVYTAASHVVSARLRIDDVLDAFAVHGACGVWSLVAGGLFAKAGDGGDGGGGGVFTGGDGRLLAAALVAAPTHVDLYAPGPPCRTYWIWIREVGPHLPYSPMAVGCPTVAEGCPRRTALYVHGACRTHGVPFLLRC